MSKPLLGPLFDRASFTFTQPGNTVRTTDETEVINIDLVTQLPGEEPFVVIKTEGWSVDDGDEILKLINAVKEMVGWSNTDTNHRS